MTRPFPIFYEDDWGPVKEFGLHELLVSMIADVKGSDWWTQKPRYEALPKKGDSRLLAACKEDVPDMPDAQIFALFDADKLHRLLRERGRHEPEALLTKLREQCPDVRLHLYLVIENTETVVDAVADCLGVDRPRKNKLERDRLLLRAARAPARELRDCVRDAVPSFAACADDIAART